MKTYKIKEIFGPTLQGEGSHSGSVVKFLRFAGCNRWSGLEKDRAKSICHYCDTDFRGGTALTANEIAYALEDLGWCKQVVISGGEATLQLDRALLEELKAFGYTIHLETNGSKDISDYEELIDHITMSPKQTLEKTKLRRCDDLKILYPSIAEDISMEGFANFPAEAKYLQPVWGPSYEANLEEAVLKLYDNPSWKLSLQTHKITGVK